MDFKDQIRFLKFVERSIAVTCLLPGVAKFGQVVNAVEHCTLVGHSGIQIVLATCEGKEHTCGLHAYHEHQLILRDNPCMVICCGGFVFRVLDVVVV